MRKPNPWLVILALSVLVAATGGCLVNTAVDWLDQRIRQQVEKQR